VREIKHIFLADRKYPSLLRGLQGAASSLYMREGEGVSWGKIWGKAVAVVGSRKMSPRGRELAVLWGASLAQKGVTVVSGFMYGVDVTAQKACLEAGGQTVGFWGTGLGVVYPSFQKALSEEFLKGRAVFYSEFEPRQGVERKNFLRRNRLVAGAARAVLVIEAGRRSGTMNTASWAAEYGRDVWAVPGSAGTDWLISQGAGVAENLSDLENLLQWGP